MPNVKIVEKMHRDLIDLHQQEEINARLGPNEIEIIREIFHTPLVGSYNWDYSITNDRLERLYELGKQLNWNAEDDLDWDTPVDRTKFITDQKYNAFRGFAPYEAMSEEKKIEFDWHMMAQKCSNFLHGEQGAMLVASQLVSCAPTYEAKLYASSQTFDEARHVEVFNKYLRRKIGFMYPISETLKAILDKVLGDERWYLKFIGMQLIIEGLALAAFNTAKMSAVDPLFAQVCHLVIRDEARHVTFGVNFLEDFVKTLPTQEREDAAAIAFDVCVLMRERLITSDVFAQFGWDPEEARKWQLDSDVAGNFRNLLFTRVMPNLNRVGLLTDKIRSKYDQLGLLTYSTYPDNHEIDWVELEKPLFDKSA